MTKLLCLALVLVLVACGSEEAQTETDPPFACALGELTGTWRVTYQEEAGGSCGPLAAETVNMGAPSGGGCEYTANDLSPDLCRLDYDFTCPLSDGQGSQRWIGVTRHVAEGELRGTATLQGQHPEAGTCRSTYAVTYRRL